MEPDSFSFEEWSEELSECIIGNNTFCIAVFKTDGELVFANSAMRLLFGDSIPRDSLLNPTFEKLIHINADNALIYKGFLTLGNYSTINNSITASVFLKNGKILISGGTDANQLIQNNTFMHELNREVNNLQRQLIKEKRNLEETLRQLSSVNKELKEANATKDKFFSIIAHDLKNPFIALIGFTDYLKENFKSINPDEAEHMIELMNNSSRSTYSLLEDLLMWSRSQLGKISYLPEKVSLNQLWKEIELLVINQARNKNIDIVFHDPQKVILFCDQNMFKIILRNLVTNAIKFSYPGSSVTISAEPEKINAIISVTDKGVGIDPGRFENLWQIGAGSSAKGTKQESGTGLGLILCKEFVETHGGKIWVESELNVGSSFKFTIPLFVN
jgi:signal transduction histidine kinase